MSSAIECRNPAIFRITGTGLNPSNQSGQLIWLKRHRSELLARAATAFHCKDWLYLNLTADEGLERKRRKRQETAEQNRGVLGPIQLPAELPRPPS